MMLPRGTINAIVAYLHDQKIDTNRLDSFLLRLFGKPQNGWIDLGSLELTKGDLFFKLTRSKSALLKIQLIPGETTYFFFKQISETFGISQDDLWMACKKNPQCIEGNFIPQTYKIPYGANAKDIIEYLLTYSQRMHREFAHRYQIVYGSKQWKELLSKASIIQKEAISIEEMAIISAVIDNRIKKGMLLQMDGSLNYGEYSHRKVTPRQIREDSSLFNTYKYKGLPPIPSGSVGFEALKAALYPANVSYLYFVRTSDGKHRFSNTYQEHRENFKR